MLDPRLDLFQGNQFFDDPFVSFFGGNRFLKSDYFLENGEITINVDVPGSSSDDVVVDFNKENYVLTVKVAKQYEKKDTKPSFYQRERVISEQSRSFHLSNDIDENTISAQVVNGLLTVKAKIKNKESKDSTVTIKVN
jgi:HSP20 family molecular chaperone IbpA